MGLTLDGRIAVTGVQPLCYPVYYLYTIYSLYKSWWGLTCQSQWLSVALQKWSLSSATRMFRREIALGLSNVPFYRVEIVKFHVRGLHASQLNSMNILCKDREKLKAIPMCYNQLEPIMLRTYTKQ